MIEKNEPTLSKNCWIRAVAVAPPEAISGSKSGAALSSEDPVSLFNACRIAAQNAELGVGPWARSNWALGGRSRRRQSFLLMYSMDEIGRFVNLLRQERPNLILIGAMTLCMPGAIECAKIARELLGQDVCIALGGRHATETIYLKKGGSRRTENVIHHPSSPARLIRDGQIPDLFDVVISGDGEFIVAELGAMIGRHGGNASTINYADELDTRTPGNWLASFPKAGKDLVGQFPQFPRDSLPTLAPLFGVTASFDVFSGSKTAHVFSDTGPGCAYDCDFCSERSSVTGGLFEAQTSPERLYRQLSDAELVIRSDWPQHTASAFVEDSVFLGGSPKLMDAFCSLMEDRPLEICFGAQLTIDKIIGCQNQIERLSGVGLNYLFVGVETLDPIEIGGMSKDLSKGNLSWADRLLLSMDICTRSSVRLGCAILFGLGENHSSRIALLKLLLSSREHYGQPVVVSANWAVQHPLQGGDAGANYRYLDWGTPEGPYLELFHWFGEASLRYQMRGVAPPSLSELKEIVTLLDQISSEA